MSIESRKQIFNSELGVGSEKEIGEIDVLDEMRALEEEIRREASQKLELVESGDFSEDALAEIEKAINVFGSLEGDKEEDVSDEMRALEEELRNERKAELESQIAQLKKELGQ